MSYQLNQSIQEAMERLEIFDLSPEQFSEALFEEFRTSTGVDFTNGDAELEIQFHTTLRF